MVTTFNARLISLATRCNPLVGSRKRARIDASFLDCDIHTINKDSSHSQNIKDTSHQATMDRSYYVAHTHPADGPPPKRRRHHREELQFAAATVASALADAGRPSSSLASVTAGRRRERALPPGSVDLALARVVTSREFDEEYGESEAAEGAPSEALEHGGQSQQTVAAVQHRVSMGQNEEEEQSLGGDATKNTNDDANDEGNDDECDLSSMYALSGLIQSTRHCYGLAPTTNPDAARQTTDLYRKYAAELFRKYEESEEGSEGQSSWTPSNDVGGQGSKEVDNDNRSDEQSGSEVGDGGSSTGSDSPPPPNDEINKDEGCGGESESERRESLSSLLSLDGPYSIVG